MTYDKSRTGDVLGWCQFCGRMVHADRVVVDPTGSPMCSGCGVALPASLFEAGGEPQADLPMDQWHAADWETPF